MWKLLKILSIVIVALLAVFVLVGFTLWPEYEVRREIEINAPESVVFALISDLERWPEWEPWSTSDPTIQATVGELTSGVGASQSWTGDSGSGNLVIVISDPGRGVVYDLVFDDQYECRAAITMKDLAEDSTRVSWVMNGDTKIPIIGGYLAKLMPMMIGPMFDDGLNNLKTAAEREPAGEDNETDASE